MKKTILIICVVALVFALASASMASSSYWVVKLKAGWLSGTSMTGYYTATIGADATGVASAAAAPSATASSIVSTVGSSYYITHRLDSDNPAPYSYNMTIVPGMSFSDHVGDAHEGMTYITAWTPDSYTGTAGRAMPNTMRVRVMDGQTQLALWSYADLYRASDPAAAGIGAVGFWYDYSGHYSSYAEAAAAGEQIQVIVENIPQDPTPEPGSLLALGSGLVGMFGFAIRRRRA